jgi:hypothetical protein
VKNTNLSYIDPRGPGGCRTALKRSVARYSIHL